MATKQELQQSIKKMVDGANNPKVSEVIRKSLLKSIEKAEKQLKELEKAETLEKKEELTEKQEQKVEETKEESKELVQELKQKIAKAKSQVSKAPVTKVSGASKSMSKAKQLAKKYRTAQKGVPTGDFDIERDAGRPAMPKGRRVAKKSGKVYYENRENRIDRKQPPKNYPKLADGGEMAKGGGVDSYIIQRGNGEEWVKYNKYKFGADAYKLTPSKEIAVKFDSREDAKKVINEFNLEKELEADLIVVKMADGGEMAKGGWYVVSAKDGKVVSSAFKSENEAKKYMYDLFQKNNDFSLAVKKMEDGGYVVVNLGGDRYDGGVAYQVMKGEKIVKEGLIDGDHGVEFKGKKYDGLKSLADGIGGKLVTQKMEYGGILQPMTGGVNADPRFDIYDTGAFMKKGGAVKRAMRFEDGGMNEGGSNEFLIMYRSDNPVYQNEDGFEGNPPDSMYADSAFDVLDYLRENMPDDVEVISIEEASDVYKKGGYMAKGGKIKDQYDGKTPEEVWNNLSKMQRQHFLYDHKDDIEAYRGQEFGELKSMEIIKAYNSNYNELDKNIRNRFDNHVREGQYAYGGILQPMTGGVNADPRFDIYDTGAFMKKGGYMNEGGLVKVKWSDAEYGDSARVIAENKMGLILKPYGQKFHLKFPDGTEKTYTAKELEFYKEEEYASGGGIPEGYHMMPDGTIMADSAHMKKGGKVEEGDIVLVKSENLKAEVVRLSKDSAVVEFIGRRPEGGDKRGTYELSDLKTLPNEMAMGGETKKYADWLDKKNELEKEISKLEKSIDADYSDKEVGQLTKEKWEKLDDKKEELKRHLKSGQSMAMGGAIEHGLKEGDEIVMAQENVLVVMNKKTGEAVFVDIETGKREDASHLKDKLMMMSMAKGGATEMLYSMTVYFEQKQPSGGYGINKIFTSVRAKNETEAISKAKKSVKNSYRGGMPIKNMSVLYPIKKEEITYRNGGETKIGKVTFADKVASIKKSLLERKKVPKAVQKDYGKTFSPAEAEDSAKRIVGAQTYAERMKALTGKYKKGKKTKK